MKVQRISCNFPLTTKLTREPAMSINDEEPGIVTAAGGMALAAFVVGGVMHLLQMTSFYGLWVGVFVGAVINAVSAKAAWEQGDDADSGLYLYGPLAVFMSVTSTSWFWDSRGYCAIQREAERVEFGPLSWMDVFTNTSRYDILVTDVSRSCMERGAYEYTNQYEIVLMDCTLALSAFFLIYLFFNGMASRELYASEKEAAIPASQKSTKKRISEMKVSVDNGSRCDEWHGLCVNIDDMNKMRPPVKDCSDDQLKEVIALYKQMNSHVQRLYEGPNAPVESQIKKVAQLAKKLTTVENEMKKRGVS